MVSVPDEDAVEHIDHVLNTIDLLFKWCGYGLRNLSITLAP